MDTRSIPVIELHLFSPKRKGNVLMIHSTHFIYGYMASNNGRGPLTKWVNLPYIKCWVHCYLKHFRVLIKIFLQCFLIWYCLLHDRCKTNPQQWVTIFLIQFISNGYITVNTKYVECFVKLTIKCKTKLRIANIHSSVEVISIKKQLFCINIFYYNFITWRQPTVEQYSKPF